jgi:hypothetical protein
VCEQLHLQVFGARYSESIKLEVKYFKSYVLSSNTLKHLGTCMALWCDPLPTLYIAFYIIYPLPLMSHVHSDNVHVCLVLRDIKALACRLAHNSRVV